MTLPPDAIQRFDEHLDELEDEHGIELSASDRQALFERSVAGGFTHEATEAALGAWFNSDDDFDDDDDDFDDDDWGEEAVEPPSMMHQMAAQDSERAAAEFTAKLGRGLSERESEQLWEAAQTERGLSDRYRPEHFERAAERAGIKPWHEMEDADQARAMAARLHERNGRDPDTGPRRRPDIRHGR